MGQKVSPIGLRLGITEKWRSRWYAGKDYPQILASDLKVREYLQKRLRRAALSKIDIERKGDKTVVELWTARPGIVIGKKGAEVDVLRKELEKLTGGSVAVNIVEIKPDPKQSRAYRRRLGRALKTHYVLDIGGTESVIDAETAPTGNVERAWYR